MDFLKDAVLPQPVEHVHLLLFVMNIVFIMLIPYLGFLLCSSILSYRFDGSGRRDGDTTATRFSHLLIDLAAARKSVVAFLALIPALSLVFLLAQLLQGTPAIAPGVMAFAFLALLAGGVLLYAYKFTFRLVDVLRTSSRLMGKTREGEPDEIDELTRYAARTDHTLRRTGLTGILCLATGSVLTIGAISIAANPAAWTDVTSVFDLFGSGDFWIRLLQFVAVGLLSTGVGIFTFVFSWEKRGTGVDDAVLTLARQTAFRISVAGLVLEPLILIASVAILPATALSGMVFGLSVLSLVLFFVTAHFVYAYKRESRPAYAGYAGYTLVLAFVALFSRDGAVIGNVTREHTVKLSVAAEKNLDELKAKLGVVLVKAMSGQEIFDAKCSACHLVELRKIGPAYKDVVPKYAGNKMKLVAFIMNPVKVNPDFPSMPNQGLKPAEADSIATWLLAKVVADAGEKAGGPK